MEKTSTETGFGVVQWEPSTSQSRCYVTGCTLGIYALRGSGRVSTGRTCEKGESQILATIYLGTYYVVYRWVVMAWPARGVSRYSFFTKTRTNTPYLPTIHYTNLHHHNYSVHYFIWRHARCTVTANARLSSILGSSLLSALVQRNARPRAGRRAGRVVDGDYGTHWSNEMKSRTATSTAIEWIATAL
ncbi:hypothetical protein F5X98DRAFT_235894 [Xylaria grammica]|nr:hypothetical protein F5X98DRAFT_235894 [Xylaria grammica]